MKTVIKYSWLQSQTKRNSFIVSLRKCSSPFPVFYILCMCGVSTSKGIYIQLISIKLLICNEKGLTAAILGTDFQGIKYGYIFGSISLNRI